MTKILIVDDDPIGRKVVRRALTADGVSFFEACNGAEGLDVARREEPDLVLLDVEMPILNGEEAVRLMRADELLRDIPVVIASSVADRERVLGMIKEGISAYVLKPVNAGDLRAKVHGLLATRAKATARNHSSRDAASAVLVAHRRSELRRIVVETFKPLFYEVREAETGAGVLDQVHKGKTVLAFVELDLPLLEGNDVARRIRETMEDDAPSLVAIADAKEAELDDALREVGFVEILDGQLTSERLLEVADRIGGERGFIETSVGRCIILHPLGSPEDPAAIVGRLAERVQKDAATVPMWWVNLAVGGELLACAKDLVEACVKNDVLGNVDLHVVAGSDEATASVKEAGLDEGRIHADFEALLAKSAG